MAEIKYKLRKEDQVQVVAGKDKGKQGKVIRIDREKGKAIVAGCNMVKKGAEEAQADRPRRHPGRSRRRSQYQIS